MAYYGRKKPVYATGINTTSSVHHVTFHGNGAYIKVEVTDRLKTVVTVALLYSKRITVFQFFESLLNMGKLDFNSTFSVCNSSTCTIWFRINMIH